MKINKPVAACAVWCLTVCAGVSAQPLPGGSLNPLTIPKYVTELIIPPVMPGTNNIAGADLEIALRQFRQQVLPPPLPQTTLWGYGNPNAPTSFNNPSYTVEVKKGIPTTVLWRNDLVLDPAVCRLSPGSSACSYLPHLTAVDQTLHWANPPQICRDGPRRTDCRGNSPARYIGPVPMVTHVHGAEVGAESDGYPEAWWLPAASNIPAGYATEGTFYADITDPTGASPLYRGQGAALFSYPNDQPSTTLWYHDHTLGMTRNNVYLAAAGFYLIRDPLNPGGETGLVSGTLPGPAPSIADDPLALNTVASPVRAKIREIPVAIQDRAFNANGSLWYPNHRSFFEGVTQAQLRIPLLPNRRSDISPIWNPEAFFNTFTVNGRTWPKLEVAPERYRFRLLNACDSRFLNLAMYVVDPVTNQITTQQVPFYQIGAEQSLLPKVVRILEGETVVLPGDGTEPPQNPDPINAPRGLLMGPAERADVIVDFTGLANGTQVRVINTGPDAPFGGFPVIPADPSTTGQVMQFVVNAALAKPVDPSTPPRGLVLSKPEPLNAPFTVNRDVALLEEASALICATVDPRGNIVQVTGVPPNCPAGSLPFAPKAAVLGNMVNGLGVVQLWDDPIQQNPTRGAVEQWSVWNLSIDAHPIHIHQVKVELVGRETIVGGLQRPAEPTEAGWKDTVIAHPGEITRVKMRFDLPGLYVWHCHILSHEDNEMMVPFCVGTAGTDCPAELFPL
jgi:FtsP/CotA-like multicopper oxidase with cupredoxin domain